MCYRFKIHQTGIAGASFDSNGMRSLSHRFPMLDDIKVLGVAKVFRTGDFCKINLSNYWVNLYQI